MRIIRNEIELIEHEGKFYSPEDLAELLKVKGDIEIVVDEENWFSRALAQMAEEKQ